MADVFVSYKAEDRRRVKPLVEALEADGLSVWWDGYVGGGDEWREAIQQQLDEAKCVLVIWSKRSIGLEGHFVRDEATRAQRRHVYVPIRIDKVDPPLGFGETQAIALGGWTGSRSDQRYQSVLETVRSLVSGAPRSGRSRAARPIVDRRLILGGGVVAVAAALAGGWFALRPKAAAPPNRIAVLPFVNLSGDPSQAYFSDGIAEELRSSLSKVGLQVIGRTSSDAVKNIDTKAAAAKLGVANILMGSVRRSPSTIRIDAQLVSASDGVERWAQSYDRAPGDAIKIQTDIAQSVAEALSVALGQGGHSVLTLGSTTNVAAQDLVLRVIHDPSDSPAPIERKLAFLETAISLDPNYAEAYARKAQWLMIKVVAQAPTAESSRRGLAEALAVANRAIGIAPKMAFGYAVRAKIYRVQLQIGLALADASRAAALPGENAVVLEGYADLLSTIGQFQGALRLIQRAMSLDPLSVDPYAHLARTLYFARRYPEAADNARHSLELAPDQTTLRSFLCLALLAQGKFAEAEAEYRKLDPANFWRLTGEAVIAIRTGQRSQALDKLKKLERRWGDSDHYQYSTIYAQLGQTEDALKELELAWQARDPGLSLLRVDPFLDPIHRDPRFAALERKLGFP